MSQIDEEQDEVSQRVQNAIFGTPLLHPDEQHRCLGTFAERIEVAITFTEIAERSYYVEMQQEFAAHPHDQLLIHGQVENELISPYLKLATAAKINFAIRNDRMYKNDDDSWALILAAPQAVNREQIDINDRYPEPLTKQTADWLTPTPPALLARIKANHIRRTRAFHNRFRS